MLGKYYSLSPMMKVLEYVRVLKRQKVRLRGQCQALGQPMHVASLKSPALRLTSVGSAFPALCKLPHSRRRVR